MTAKPDKSLDHLLGENWRRVMKKVGDIMRELGFNPESSVGAQEAFVKNLIKDAYGVDVQTPTEKRMKQMRDQALGRNRHRDDHSEPKSKQRSTDAQLSFDLRDLVPANQIQTNKKKSAG